MPAAQVRAPRCAGYVRTVQPIISAPRRKRNGHALRARRSVMRDKKRAAVRASRDCEARARSDDAAARAARRARYPPSVPMSARLFQDRPPRSALYARWHFPGASGIMLSANGSVMPGARECAKSADSRRFWRVKCGVLRGAKRRVMMRANHDGQAAEDIHDIRRPSDLPAC